MTIDYGLFFMERVRHKGQYMTKDKSNLKEFNSNPTQNPKGL